MLNNFVGTTNRSETQQNPLCKYKNAFGEAGKRTGLRKYRVFGISVVDVVVVLLFSYAIARMFRRSFFQTTLVIFIIGIIVHRLFCVKTTVDIAIFGK